MTALQDQEMPGTGPAEDAASADARAKAAAEVFAKLADIVTDDGDVDELCALMAALLDGATDHDLKRLLGGWAKLAIIPDGED